MRHQTEEHRQQVALVLGRALFPHAALIIVVVVVAGAFGDAYNVRWKHLLVVALVALTAAVAPFALRSLWRARRRD